jgi:hypothetical protein
MMRRKILLWSIVAASLVCIPSMDLSAEMMSVQIKQGALRINPSFVGKIVAKVFYGDRVQTLEKKQGWSKVKLSGMRLSGWIHDSALTTKKIVFSSGKNNVPQTTTGDELALAGKGFGKQVEGKYKSNNPTADFAAIDRMEKIVISEYQMHIFLIEGQVTPEGGAL